MTASAEKTAKPPTKLEQKKYIVAFLDFLGASEKIHNNTTNKMEHGLKQNVQ